MDSILVLEGGKVIHSGPFQEIHHRSIALAECSISSETSTDNFHPSSNDCDASWQPETQHQALNSRADIPLELDERQRGNWSVYAYYWRSAQTFSMIAWAVSLLLAVWINIWTEANRVSSNKRLGYYLGVYATLVILTMIGMAGELWFSFMKIINDTALKLHSDLLNTTLRAPVSFFQHNDIGSILNRFNQDMDIIDMVLPTQAAQFTTGLAYCIVQLIILCVLGKYLTATIPVCAGVMFFLQRYYLRTSRQVRLLEIEAKAPLYKHFVETLLGATTIRAFGRRPMFHRQQQQILDMAQAPYYMLFCIQQWLALVLDLMTGALAVIIAAIALLPSRFSSHTNIGAGDLGVALVIILQFSSLLSQSIQAWTKLETSIGAIHRVQKFVEGTPQEPAGSHLTPPDWPSLGSICFENVVASYSTYGPPVLADINLAIGQGEKIAICGSSGSGKSTIIMALLRLLEIQGRIIIDDINVSHLSGQTLRSRLNVLPQEPFFLPGTVRTNLDVRGLSSLDAIREAIEKVGLWDSICNSGGLDADLDPSQWSQGQKQLLCLARALLTPSKVLILDEATSSVDDETESTMLDVIGSSFKEHTVISVIHRFAKMEQYNRVAVLNQGKIVEYDTPQALLGRESKFRELFRAYTSKHESEN